MQCERFDDCAQRMKRNAIYEVGSGANLMSVVGQMLRITPSAISYRIEGWEPIPE